MANQLDLLFFLGRPLSPVYGFVMRAREKAYQKKILKQNRLPVPVISVGNLTLGGTGKTPVVSHIAKLLQDNGYTPVIVSRGYGGKAKNTINIVADADGIKLRPIEAGDEPYMLAQNLPGIAVLTGRKRILPCRYAVDNLDADCLVLDDGFQHLGVQRDLDFVLFDATNLAGNSRIFPGGELREPVAALNRCTGFLLTGVNEANRQRSDQFADLLKQRFTNKPVFRATHGTPEIVDSIGTVINDFSSFKLYGFCGIANPQRFTNSTEQLGAQIQGCTFLKDHQAYNQTIVNKICENARNSGATHLITTCKDFVKLKHVNCDLPLLILKIDLSIETSFDDLIINSINKASS